MHTFNVSFRNSTLNLNSAKIFRLHFHCEPLKWPTLLQLLGFPKFGDVILVLITNAELRWYKKYWLCNIVFSYPDIFGGSEQSC
jgi:hypothetical protein